MKVKLTSIRRQGYFDTIRHILSQDSKQYKSLLWRSSKPIDWNKKGKKH